MAEKTFCVICDRDAEKVKVIHMEIMTDTKL